jgi:hypothetical protein
VENALAEMWTVFFGPTPTPRVRNDQLPNLGVDAFEKVSFFGMGNEYLIQRHEDVWGSGDKALHILNVVNRWRCLQLHAPLRFDEGYRLHVAKKLTRLIL